METAKNFLLLCASFFLALACKNPAAPSARPNNIEKLKNEYTVTYNAKGGKGEMKDSVFTIGVLAKLPPNTFTFEGSVFTGWALAEYGDVEFADKAEIIDLAPAGETITLYASWGINVYTVEYDPNGGEGIMPLSVFTLGKVFALAANAFAKEGYTFAGWALSAGGDAVYADGEEAQDLTPNAGETVVLYAVWKNISYTVAYNANGGSGEMEHSVLSYDEPQDLRPNVFTFEDLVFAGWSTATEGEVVYADEQTVLNLTNIQGEALTLYAIWGSGIYTVSYIANGGSGYMAPGIATLYQEFTLAANSFTREGYFFAGWSLLNNGEVHFEDEASIQNVEDNAGKTIKFYAVWLPEMHITFPHELWALYGQSLSDINIYDNFYCSIPGTCAWEKPDEYFSSAGTYVYKIIFTPEDLVNYTEAAQEAEITVYPRYVDISGRPGRTLIPFDSADELYGKTSMLEITLDGLLDGDIITLGIDEGYGLSLSGNDGIGSKTQRTVVVNYDGSTVDGSGPVSLELHIIGNDNYVLYNAIEFELTVLDGQAENRAIPVTQANAAAFNEYANSPEGLGRHYALAQDITLGQGNNWTPIGASASPFTGGFNGKGFTVSNLAMNSTANYQGMFGYIGTGGLVKNTALINANVKGGSYAGGLAGHSSGTVEGCYVTGSVSGSFYVGGIAGFNSGTVRNCYATSNVNCNSNAGGIVGCNNNGTVLNCFTTGRISGITGIGGIAGLNSMGTIRDCAALNSIITMSSSASTGIGRVTGSAGGGAMTNNYGRSDMMAKHNWNGTNGTNKTITGTGTHSGIDGHGISLEQLDTQSLWVTASNWASAGAWNFTEVWELNANNMPKLRPAGGSQNHALPLGDGTEADPFRVYNEATLRRVGTGTDGWDLDKQYLQIQDVTLPLPAAGQGNWTAIGTEILLIEDSFFTGVYDGGGYVIINLIINSTVYLQGMFRMIGPGGMVKDLGLIGGSAKGGDSTGSVAGLNVGTVQNCYTTGNVSGGTLSGGIAGSNNGTVQNCYTTGSTSGGGTTGGVTGSNYGTVQDCYATGSVSSSYKTGGVAGSNSGTVQDCYATGTINGELYVGGIVGDNSGTVQDCYATGNINGNSDYIGGVAGYNYGNGSIKSCFATGNINGDLFTGGVVGNNIGMVESCYAAGNVSGGSNNGGVAGRNNGMVQNCYAIGNVSGGNFIGGIVGLNESNGILQNCYTMGNARGSSYTGGIAGYNSGTLQNCVALQMILTISNTSAYIGRISGYSTSASLFNNYARGDMTVMYNWNGSNGTVKTINAGLSTIDGASIGQWDFNAPSWWQNEYIWTRGGVYNFADIWEMNTNNLPVLKNMGNIQDHSVLAADGSTANPFPVYDVNTLKKVGSGTDGWAMNKHYRQVQNIILPPPAAGQGNWTAIGTSSVPFTGSFDGNGCTVSNLVVNSTANCQGMFGYIGTGAVLKNIALANCTVNGGNYSGGIAGYTGGTVQECYVSGSVSGGSYTAGIAGYSTGMVQNCYSISSASGGSNVGGIVGQNNNIVQNCYATGRVSGSSNAGGVVGSGGTVRNCAALNAFVATSLGTGTVGRVMGTGGGVSNYARSDMALKYNWTGFTGANKSISAGLTTLDGANIAAAQWNSSSWWQAAGNWNSAAVWNFTGVWAMNVNNLPVLKNAGGMQNHALDASENIDFIEMQRIPAGSFIMGSPASEEGRFDDEGPQHAVTLAAFSMGKYPVTQEQYQAVTGQNPSGFKTAVYNENVKRLPVEMVTWYDAVEFCNKLSQIEGFTPVYAISGRTPASGYPITGATVTANLGNTGYRLPTEAEWEYACRAGTSTAYYTGEILNYYTGWYYEYSMNTTHEVGLLLVNAWGLYDMHGNVWEWCGDWFGNYSSAGQTNPVGPASGTTRVNRGGSWYSTDQGMRSACRNGNLPSNQFGNLGFRVVRR